MLLVKKLLTLAEEITAGTAVAINGSGVGVTVGWGCCCSTTGGAGGNACSTTGGGCGCGESAIIGRSLGRAGDGTFSEPFVGSVVAIGKSGSGFESFSSFIDIPSLFDWLCIKNIKVKKKKNLEKL